MLKVHILEFLFSSEFTGIIGEFVEILPHSFRGNITPKFLGDKSVALIECSRFEINFYRVGLQDEIYWTFGLN